MKTAAGQSTSTSLRQDAGFVRRFFLQKVQRHRGLGPRLSNPKPVFLSPRAHGFGVNKTAWAGQTNGFCLQIGRLEAQRSFAETHEPGPSLSA